MPVLSSNVKASLGPIPSPFSGATTWAALTPVINTINTNFNVIANGAGFIPGTVRLINGRPVNLSTGDLPVLLSDIPDAASNVYVKNTFATTTTVNTSNNNFTAQIAAVNAAVQILRSNIAALPAGGNGNTAQISGWIQSNVAQINTAWTANAGAQQTSINTLNNTFNSYTNSLNTQIGSLYGSVDTIQRNIDRISANVSTLLSNAATQSTQITATSGNLSAYQTRVDANLSTATNNITTLQSQISGLTDVQNSVNASIGNMSSEISALTSAVADTNTNLLANVNMLKANITTLTSTVAAQAAAVSALGRNVATLANTASRTVHVSNQAPTLSDGAVGDIWYQTV